ncbi:hypothetical protein BpHYR1_002633 [Brachionus plicatilis]|uniref:Uncharacterized protein n=1 Tax=Brachionus plicatilis TaxID=10195 RepID=A0A3M7QRJ8_BRAPC|nr:hypothetical protein BpHYR1_002633 [Brachionus plicatilis]
MIQFSSFENNSLSSSCSSTILFECSFTQEIPLLIEKNRNILIIKLRIQIINNCANSEISNHLLDMSCQFERMAI